MRHLNTFEPASQDFKRISYDDYMRLVYSPNDLFNKPNCQSPKQLEFCMSRVVSAVGSKPSESFVRVISYKRDRMALVRADSLSTNPTSCYVGFRMLFNRSQEDKTYWSGEWAGRKFSFTRPGLIHKLVGWLDRGNRGTYLDFLIHAGRVPQGVALPGQYRGQHSAFFSAARAAGIISLRREGRRHIVVPGPNYEDFKSGRLRPVDWVGGNLWLYVDAIFLNDDWVALKVSPWVDYRNFLPPFRDGDGQYQIFKCDGNRGVEAAILGMLGTGRG